MDNGPTTSGNPLHQAYAGDDIIEKTQEEGDLESKNRKDGTVDRTECLRKSTT